MAFVTWVVGLLIVSCLQDGLVSELPDTLIGIVSLWAIIWDVAQIVRRKQ